MVSVIVPTYNRGGSIVGTLDSILLQRYRPIEIVVVDDGSTDNTQRVTYQWAQHIDDQELHFRYLRQENSGAPSARNSGMRASTGQYLQFLDSDDTIEPEKILQQVHALKRCPLNLAVCDFAYVNGSGAAAKVSIVRNSGDLHSRLVYGWSVSVSTPLMSRRSVFGKAWWEESLVRSQDMDFMIKVFCLNDSYVYIPEAWCYYNQHSGPRISDIYRSTDFPYFSVIVSLVKFGLVSYTHISRSGRQFLFKNIRYLSRNLARSIRERSILSAKKMYVAMLPRDIRLRLRKIRGKA